MRRRAATARHCCVFFAAISLVSLLAGCQHAVDGRRVFLQSEVALDKVQFFRAHIESYGLGTVATDAQYDCDRPVFHYIETDQRLNRKLEYIQTQPILFSRELPASSNWNALRQPNDLGVCERLRNGGQLGQVPSRLFSADQGRILPPFFYYANETGAVITPMGEEAIDGVYCEIWKVSDRDSAFPLHTIWIGAEDRLPRKYVEGQLDSPRGMVTYSDYGAHFDIDVPPNPFSR